jgi:hypothetical protein
MRIEPKIYESTAHQICKECNNTAWDNNTPPESKKFHLKCRDAALKIIEDLQESQSQESTSPPGGSFSGIMPARDEDEDEQFNPFYGIDSLNGEKKTLLEEVIGQVGKTLNVNQRNSIDLNFSAVKALDLELKAPKN